jgi:hypothetical protein
LFGPAQYVGVSGLNLIEGKVGGLSGAADAINITNRYGRGGPIDVDLSHGSESNFLSTLYAAVMQRNYRTAVYWYAWQAPWTPHTLQDMEQLLRDTPGEVRFLVTTSQAPFFTKTADPEAPIVPGCQPALCVPIGSAPTKIQAAQYLAARYPDKVEIVLV